MVLKVEHESRELSSDGAVKLHTKPGEKMITGNYAPANAL